MYEGKALIDEICTIGTNATADKLLRDAVCVDWGSFAWKSTKAEIAAFFRATGICSTTDALADDKDYAVVFKEEVGGWN